MRRLAVLGLGGILADDMGLGKTVQVLAHIMDERARVKIRDPALVVGTTSLVANWCAEAERFCPGLRVVHLQRPKAERQRVLEEIASADLVVTTYPLLVRDLESLRPQHFSLVVLDEAQAIKNPTSQAARAVRALDADRRLAMTGTPLENHLGELWAQVDAVAPGFLGSAQWFGRQFRRPIEQHGDPEPLAVLRRRLAPLMLRRTRKRSCGSCRRRPRASAM
ncbi:MAG: SNF2-related protein [Gammaproteobacteria bacterium]|nr:SNF2-related protein [Gammaproteobacteria bacterium]